ncbi:MAG: energy transducer TonB, partial [Nitrospirales bacterium]
QDLAKQLEQLERVLPPPRPTTVEPPPATPPVPKAPPQTASVPDLANPGARLQVQGVAPGFSEYLARVQNEISKQWVAPAVDTEGRVLEVVIQFRLHRSGAVSGVEVERSSGNDYYDLAGKRAILASYPLPPFPPEMRNGYVDAHFSFIVGKQNG